MLIDVLNSWCYFKIVLSSTLFFRLVVPASHVKSVYRAAVKLKMPDAARACSKHLTANLTSANCLGISLRLAGRFNLDNWITDPFYVPTLPPSLHSSLHSEHI